MLPPARGRFLTQVKNGLLVLAVPFLPVTAVLPAVAVAMVASGVLARLVAGLGFIGQHGRAEREGGGCAGADEECTDCFHLKLLVVVG
jgi:hypothetical protein